MRWKAIPGFEGLYRVSDQGQVYSVVTGQNVAQRDGTDGYPKVNLSKDGKVSTFEVHKLVADAFCNHPAGHDSINHKDENKHNNKASNLEWMTIGDQNRYGTRTERARQTLMKKK